MKALTATEFNFPGQTSVYHGKVRDVYNIGGEKLVMVATDRISAFDVVLPKGIPFKGQMLNQIAAKFLDATTDICPNWKMATPDPMVTVGVMCEGFAVEMIVRGYLCGSAWRAYKSGVREICGVKLPEGMKENQKFPTPIITPTTKAEIGEHDQDISKEEILAQGLATPEEYALLEKYTLALFQRGTEIAAERGLILVDTKYEFGKHGGELGQTVVQLQGDGFPDDAHLSTVSGNADRFDDQCHLAACLVCAAGKDIIGSSVCKIKAFDVQLVVVGIQQAKNQLWGIGIGQPVLFHGQIDLDLVSVHGRKANR